MADKSRAIGSVAPGRIKEIDSPSNTIIKDIKALEKKRVRTEANAFFVEGHKLVVDALAAGWSVRTLIVGKNASSEERVSEFVSLCVAKGIDTLLVSNKALASLARRDNPQMVCAVVEQKRGTTKDVLNMEPGAWVALDRVRDPGNLGTIVRTVDALGAHGVILIGDTTDPFATETVRATMGSIFAKPIVTLAEADFLEMASRFAGLIVGTHLEGSVDFRVPDYTTEPTILLMGNEQAGLTEALVDACDYLVRIPQAGTADSLNLAIATAICLFKAREHDLRPAKQALS
ncbi:MAG: RNA methyltransferase [Pseudomonadota bacterium]